MSGWKYITPSKTKIRKTVDIRLIDIHGNGWQDNLNVTMMTKIDWLTRKMKGIQGQQAKFSMIAKKTYSVLGYWSVTTTKDLVFLQVN